MEKWVFFCSGNGFFCTGKMLKSTIFSKSLLNKFFIMFIHRKVFHFPQHLWKNQRQELILEVMSRMCVCSSSFPLFSIFSIFSMEYKIVV